MVKRTLLTSQINNYNNRKEVCLPLTPPTHPWTIYLPEISSPCHWSRWGNRNGLLQTCRFLSSPRQTFLCTVSKGKKNVMRWGKNTKMLTYRTYIHTALQYINPIYLRPLRKSFHCSFHHHHLYNQQPFSFTVALLLGRLKVSKSSSSQGNRNLEMHAPSQIISNNIHSEVKLYKKMTQVITPEEHCILSKKKNHS